MKRAWLVVTVVALSSCRDLSFPDPPPPPGPGTISGRAVLPLPGRSEKAPAAGASVRLLPTGLVTTTDEQGLFVLEGVTRETGELLVQFDGNGDGRFERQRVVRIDGYKPGFGKQVQVGDVALDENALIRGRVLLSNVQTTSGHGGSVVFVPEGPFTTTTADDGRFQLENMPAGTLRLAFFHAGYASKGFEELTVAAGSELALNDVQLDPVAMQEPGTVAGTLTATPTTPLDPARVELLAADGLSRVASPDAAGAFRFTTVPSGVYRLTVTLAGYRSARVDNVFVSPAQLTQLGVIDLVKGADLPFPDAGVVDGGGKDDAGVDDGGKDLDAGSDAGTTDAGTNDAGIDAGSVDAGDPRAPTARVASVLSTRPAGSVLLDGSASTDPGGLPLLFHWAQTSGTSVLLSVNDSLQGTTQFMAPANPEVLRFELTVSNTLGLTSAPAVVLVTVQGPPTARVLPGTASLRVGLSLELDGRGSTDPSGGPLTYEWAVLSGPLTLAAFDGGVAPGRVQVLAGNTTGVGEVELAVRNSVGLRSDPVRATLTVTNDPVVLGVDAGLPTTVGFGASVVLRATATSTDPQDSFSYTWAQVGPDGGAPGADAGVQLSTTAGPVTSFTAPATPQDLFFAVTATGTHSLLASTASVRTSVIDDQPPFIIASDPPISGGPTLPDGPWWEMVLTFNEPLDVGSLSGATIRLTENDAGVPIDVAWEPTASTVRINPRHPLSLGATAVLSLSGVTDASSRRNPLPPTTLPFLVRAVAHRTFTLATGETGDILAVPLIIGRDVGWVGFNRATSGCGASPSPHFSAITGAALSPSIEGVNGCACTRNEQRNHAVVGPRAYYSCGAGSLFSNQGSSFVIVAANGPNSLNTDGVTLGGTKENIGMQWLGLLATGWSAAEQVESSSFYVNSGNVPPAYGGAVAPGRNLALGVLQFGTLRIFEEPSGGPWNSISESNPPVNTIMPRGAYAGTRPVVCMTNQNTLLTLRCVVRNGSSWTTFEDLGAGSVDRVFDVQAYGDTVFLAYSQAGSVKVRTLDTADPGATFRTLPGPSGASVWNVNLGCTAKNPALQVRSDGVWVAFQETCSSAWTAVLRKAY
ncbi:MAG: carboxypeptidase regulatory-like domain-containing protein [Myxococcaceae bacterium]